MTISGRPALIAWALATNLSQNSQLLVQHVLVATLTVDWRVEGS